LNKRAGIILQARMGSSRLPGKTLGELSGKPMLWHIIERLKRVRESEELIIATTTNVEDQDILELATSCGVKVFSGSEEDVLDRFYQAAGEFGLRHIIRATGDNPLVDPEEADRLIGFHIKEALDYSSNKTEAGSGLPVGVGVEAFSFEALERLWAEAKEAGDREHIDEYILHNPDNFNTRALKAPAGKQAPELRLTVDTDADFGLMNDIYKRFYVPSKIIAVEEAINYLLGSGRNKA